MELAFVMREAQLINRGHSSFEIFEILTNRYMMNCCLEFMITFKHLLLVSLPHSSCRFQVQMASGKKGLVQVVSDLV